MGYKLGDGDREMEKVRAILVVEACGLRLGGRYIIWRRGRRGPVRIVKVWACGACPMLRLEGVKEEMSLSDFLRAWGAGRGGESREGGAEPRQKPPPPPPAKGVPLAEVEPLAEAQARRRAAGEEEGEGVEAEEVSGGVPGLEEVDLRF